MSSFSGQGISPKVPLSGAGRDDGGSDPLPQIPSPSPCPSCDGSGCRHPHSRAQACAGLGEHENNEYLQKVPREHFTEVFVSVLLNKLLVVDEQKYQFEVVFHLRLSWTDPRAKEEIDRRTAETVGQGRHEQCERLCGGTHAALLCCDSIWLPGLHASNIVEMPEAGSDAQAISLVPGNHSQVVWKRRIHSTFHSPLFFQRFPFDRQKLLVEFLLTGCCYFFSPSTSGMRMAYNAPQRLLTDLPSQISSWKLHSVSISAQPFALEAAVNWHQDAHPAEGFDIRTEYILGGKGLEAFNTSFSIVIEIHRLWLYYVVMFVGPIFLTVLLSWATLCVTPEYLELRIATSITLFLALTSERGVIFESLPHSNYVTIMGYVIVWSYILIVATVFQSLLVSYVYSVSSKFEEDKKLSAFEEATRKLTIVENELSRESVRQQPVFPWSDFVRGSITPSGAWLSRSTTENCPNPSLLHPRTSGGHDRSNGALHPGSDLSSSGQGNSSSPLPPLPSKPSLRFPLNIPGRMISAVSTTLVGKDLNPFRSGSANFGSLSEEKNSTVEPLVDESVKEDLVVHKAAPAPQRLLEADELELEERARPAGKSPPNNNGYGVDEIAGEGPREVEEAKNTEDAGDDAAANCQSLTRDISSVRLPPSSELHPDVTNVADGHSPNYGKAPLPSRRSKGRASRIAVRQKKRGITVSESGKIELPHFQDISQDPLKAKIFISSLDGFCLIFFPLIYVSGLALIYFLVE